MSFHVSFPLLNYYMHLCGKCKKSAGKRGPILINSMSMLVRYHLSVTLESDVHPLCRILLHSRTLAGNFAPEAVGKL